MKKYNLGLILRCIPFYISAAAACCLMFMPYRKLEGLLLSTVLLCLMAVIFRLDPAAVNRHGTTKKWMLSGFVSYFLAKYFHQNFPAEGMMEKVTSLLHIGADTLRWLCTLFFFAGSVYFFVFLTCSLMERMDWEPEWQQITNKIRGYVNLRAVILILAVVYLIAFSALIRADVDFYDDMGRKVDGYPNWEVCSRFLSDFLSRILHANFYLGDISPLPQVIAMAIMIAASMIVLVVFGNGKKIDGWSIVAVLPLGVSPWFLGCMSYKFDAPYMALSVLSSMIPLLFLNSNPLLYTVSVFLGTLVSCITYQASLGILPAAVILYVFLRWRNDDSLMDLGKQIAFSVLGYLAAVLLYRVAIMTPPESYVNTELLPLLQMPVGVISNLRRYFQRVFSSLDMEERAMLAVVFIGFVLLMAQQSRKKKWMTIVLAVVAVVLSSCLSFGLYIAFAEPMIVNRTMYGFGVELAMVAVICAQQKRADVVRLCSLYLSFTMIVFTLLYGNAWVEQRRYIDFRTETALQALNGVPGFGDGGNKNLEITGSVGFSPILEEMPQRVRLGWLIGRTFAGDDSDWNDFTFWHFYDLENVTEAYDLNRENMELLHDGYYETIYGDGENFILELKEY